MSAKAAGAGPSGRGPKPPAHHPRSRRPPPPVAAKVRFAPIRKPRRGGAGRRGCKPEGRRLSRPWLEPAHENHLAFQSDAAVIAHATNHLAGEIPDVLGCGISQADGEV